MSASIEQAAANLAAALQSGLAQDAVAALASYDEAIEGVEDVPEADLGPIKAPLAEEDIAAAEDEDDGGLVFSPVEDEDDEDLDVPGLSVEGVDIDAVADEELGNS